MSLFSANRPPRSAPRPAATVLVLRTAADPDQPDLFMVRRSGKSPFMPDALVFPGGRVDADDGAPDTDAAFEAAAIRECREEAAVELASNELSWFDTWLTPSAEPRRYLARFYLTVVSAAQAATARHDGVEATEGHWDSSLGFIRRWEAGEVDLAPPTLSILLRLGRGDWRGLTARARAAVSEPILPKLIDSDDSPRILLPGHRDYPAADGEAGPRPDRLADYPTGFSRQEKRWIPCFD